jgi:PD-(D/E)XK endonuclease
LRLFCFPYMPKQRRSQRRNNAPEETPASVRRMTKRLGEMGEAAFLAKAAFMGMEVSRPWGDSNRYDLIIDVGGRLLRVQLKSAHRVCAQPGGGYHVRASPHQRVPYGSDEIDLLVAYIVPENIWYVFPPSAFQNMKSMRLFPYRGKKISKFEKFREAWHLIPGLKQKLLKEKASRQPAP